VNARQDYDDQKYDRLALIEGTWPQSGGVTVDRGSASKLGIPLGATILFEVGERTRSMTVVGITYDTWANPPAFTSDAQFYATRRDIERLGGPTGFSQIRAVLPQYDEALAKEKAVEITDRLDRLDIGHGTPDTYDPQRHFFQDVANGIFMLLIVMSFLTVGLSVFLVTNTVTAIVAEQVPQIGVMKAVGARSLSIFQIYLGGVIVYLTLALLIAIPLGIVGSYILSATILSLFNMEAGPFRVSWLAVAVQLVLGLTSPLVAALWPVTAGARLTVREAISSYGLSVRIGMVERAIASLRRLPPLVVLTLSNTFRKKGRLAMTLVSLVGGGAIFMMVMSVQHSMVRSFDQFFETWKFDIMVGFANEQRINSIEPLVESFPGVSYAEMIQFYGSGIRRMDDEAGLDEESIELMGVSKDGDAYGPVVRAGRFLLPDDERAVALNEGLARELGVSVGDQVVIEINDEDTTWTVVGLVFDVANQQQNSIVWLDVLSHELNRSGRGDTLFVGAETRDPQRQTEISRELREWLDSRGKDVGSSMTAAQVRTENISSLMIIVYLLLVIAILIAVVGSVGLSGALSISALERQKEVGVMRAIGASGLTTGGIFVGKGIIIGLISWLLAIPLSVPLGMIITSAIGSTIDFQFSFSYSYIGTLIWLVVVVALSIVASGMPAWRAARVSVRQVLSYE
jgi:putative ABC transport system permease protein